MTRDSRFGLVLFLASAAAATMGVGVANARADTSDPVLLDSITSQTPEIVSLRDFTEAYTLAQATQVWIQQDTVLCAWPKYEDVRDALTAELSQVMHLDRATTGELRAEAAWHRSRFWKDDGAHSADGYRRPYKARILLEIAQSREPANLAISDELVETILTSHPLDYFDPETGQRLPNAEVILSLRALRSSNYEQLKQEIEQGRSFTWEDFARVADYVFLWSARDPQKATEAFQWGLGQVGPSLRGSDYEGYAQGVLATLEKGQGAGLNIYLRLRLKYPHDYLYARRLPSFKGFDPEGQGLTPMLAMGTAATVPFGY